MRDEVVSIPWSSHFIQHCFTENYGSRRRFVTPSLHPAEQSEVKDEAPWFARFVRRSFDASRCRSEACRRAQLPRGEWISRGSRPPHQAASHFSIGPVVESHS